MPQCGSAKLEQDPDVLDTWFSSGAVAVLDAGLAGRDARTCKTYYPTSLLITGFDILFFWVARMIMMGLEFMGDVPFREVYIHGLVRDAERQKMSKTRGNVIDPLEVTEKYGTDAVRMALLLGAAPGTDIVLTEERMVSARAFANKIWNAARFLFMNMERSGVEPWVPEECVLPPEPWTARRRPLEDRWIFSRLNSLRRPGRTAPSNAIAITRPRRSCGSSSGTSSATGTWKSRSCASRRTPGLDDDWRNVLTVFEAALRLLHPVMPFLTEELWQRLAEGIAGTRPFRSRWPVSAVRHTRHRRIAAEREMQLLQEIVTAARNLRAEMKADPKQQLDGVLYSQTAARSTWRASSWRSFRSWRT